jgi:hypothetical protein
MPSERTRCVFRSIAPAQVYRSCSSKDPWRSIELRRFPGTKSIVELAVENGGVSYVIREARMYVSEPAT